LTCYIVYSKGQKGFKKSLDDDVFPVAVLEKARNDMKRAAGGGTSDNSNNNSNTTNNNDEDKKKKKPGVMYDV